MSRLAQLLRDRADATPYDPTLTQALDAMRFLNTTLIRESRDRFLDSLDALAVVENYVYRHATPDEFHEHLARRNLR